MPLCLFWSFQKVNTPSFCKQQRNVSNGRQNHLPEKVQSRRPWCCLFLLGKHLPQSPVSCPPGQGRLVTWPLAALWVWRAVLSLQADALHWFPNSLHFSASNWQVHGLLSEERHLRPWVLRHFAHARPLPHRSVGSSSGRPVVPIAQVPAPQSTCPIIISAHLSGWPSSPASLVRLHPPGQRLCLRITSSF